MKPASLATFALIMIAGDGGLATAGALTQSRDQIRIVGSSTVFPYTQAVAEQFGLRNMTRSPVVETTGTGGGMVAFCAGLGTDYADITGASRAMTESEYHNCVAHGVDDITEALIGYDGLSIAQSIDGPDMDLSKAEIFQALAAEVEVAGRIVENPYRRWSEIDARLPDMPIQVFGPPPTSGTRDIFVALVMDIGCAGFAAIDAAPPERRRAICARMRQDGPFIEAGENDTLIVRRLSTDPTALGLFGYSFLHENTDILKAVAVDGVAPDAQSIATGEYTLSRPLYIYVKNAHRAVIPGLDDLAREYVSEESLGDGGYLTDRGLIPLSAVERAAVRAQVAAARRIDRFD